MAMINTISVCDQTATIDKLKECTLDQKSEFFRGMLSHMDGKDKPRFVSLLQKALSTLELHDEAGLLVELINRVVTVLDIRVVKYIMHAVR